MTSRYCANGHRGSATCRVRGVNAARPRGDIVPAMRMDAVGRGELVGMVERAGRGRCRDCGNSARSGCAGFPYLSPFPGGIPFGWDALPLVGNPSLWCGVCPFSWGWMFASKLAPTWLLLPPGFCSHGAGYPSGLRLASWGYWLGLVRSSSM